jgi:hypothetical protein
MVLSGLLPRILTDQERARSWAFHWPSLVLGSAAAHFRVHLMSDLKTRW